MDRNPFENDLAALAVASRAADPGASSKPLAQLDAHVRLQDLVVENGPRRVGFAQFRAFGELASQPAQVSTERRSVSHQVVEQGVLALDAERGLQGALCAASLRSISRRAAPSVRRLAASARCSRSSMGTQTRTRTACGTSRRSTHARAADQDVSPLRQDDFLGL